MLLRASLTLNKISQPFIRFSGVPLCELLLSAISPQRGSNYLTRRKLVYLGSASPL